MKQSKKTNQSRADKTKAQLIDAGLEVFSKYGFLGATTRNIAKFANVNISAIAYYFNNKEGLYLAVVETIAEQIMMKVKPMIFMMRFLLTEDHPKKYYVDKLVTLLSTITLATLNPQANKFGLIMIQEQLNPTKAMDIIYENYLGNILGIIQAFLQKLTTLNEEETIILAQSLVSEAIIFNLAKQNLRRALKVETLTEHHIETIKMILTKQIEGWI